MHDALVTAGAIFAYAITVGAAYEICCALFGRPADGEDMVMPAMVSLMWPLLLSITITYHVLRSPFRLGQGAVARLRLFRLSRPPDIPRARVVNEEVDFQC